MQEYWKINYTENGEQKEEIELTINAFEERIQFIWYNIDGSASATSGSYNA
jgi:hypothetical protein